MTAAEKPGASTQFEFERMTVERFRATFPKARWDDVARAWWVPGKTAERRIERWKALEQAKADVHADARGRDAFEFDPIESRYLLPAAEIVVQTPYSRTVVNELRQVPYAHWDAARTAWMVPYRSYEELKRRWPVIEAAAKRNEPEERKARREANKDSDARSPAGLRRAERRRRRHPIPLVDPPPLDRPVTTVSWGIVVFTDTQGEIVDPQELGEVYSMIRSDGDMIWAAWRTPTLKELVETWPARNGPNEREKLRGWWHSTKPELVIARRDAKSRERRLRNA
ncbi:hypothetical protein [Rhizobium sp. FKL33]|uniref:hypothetical protein n=1 Tax=Rhizobium sp. FKL33 TaxID=2562307 RepID=UPI0010C1040C|nr:hypothetical protein [Rhizobium sp. FKL33]